MSHTVDAAPTLVRGRAVTRQQVGNPTCASSHPGLPSRQSRSSACLQQPAMRRPATRSPPPSRSVAAAPPSPSAAPRSPPGRVTFEVDSTRSGADGGRNVSPLRLQPGITVQQFVTGMGDEFSQDPATAAKGIQELVTDARFLRLGRPRLGNPGHGDRERAARHLLPRRPRLPARSEGPPPTRLTVSEPGGQGQIGAT